MTLLLPHILTFSEKGDFIALTIELTLNEVISILLDLDGNFVEKIVKGKIDNETMTTSDNNVISSICRLFWIMEEPVQLTFMGNHIKREIIFLF